MMSAPSPESNITDMITHMRFSPFGSQPGLVLARRLMAVSLDIRDSFDDVQGPELVLQLSETYAQDLDFQVRMAAWHTQNS